MRKFAILLTLLLTLAIVVIPALAIDEDEEGVKPVFFDGRINNSDVAAPVAVFGTDFETGRGLEVWAPIGFKGAGVLVLRVTPEEIAAVEARPVESTMVDAGDLLGVKLYRLPNGDFQLWASCNQVEWYSLTFDEVLGPNTGYTSYFYK